MYLLTIIGLLIGLLLFLVGITEYKDKLTSAGVITALLSGVILLCVIIVSCDAKALETKTLQDYNIVVQQVEYFKATDCKDAAMATNIFTLTQEVNDAITTNKAYKEHWWLRHRYRESIGKLEPIIINFN